MRRESGVQSSYRRFGFWCNKRSARRTPRRPRHRRGELGQNPILCGYYTITAGPSGLCAAKAAFKSSYRRFGLWGNRRSARRPPRRPRHRRGELGQSPILCGYYTISFDILKPYFPIPPRIPANVPAKPIPEKRRRPARPGFRETPKARLSWRRAFRRQSAGGVVYRRATNLPFTDSVVAHRNPQKK